MSLTAERNEQFSEKEYWDQRYADESEQDFDWFKKVSRRSRVFARDLFLLTLVLNSMMI